MQDEFELLILSAFRSGSPRLQKIVTMKIRPWHWFRTSERRALHDHLFWNEAKHGDVIACSLSARQGYYRPAEQEKVFRLLFERNDIENAKQLAKTFGQMLGFHSILIDRTASRLPAAEVARDVVQRRTPFPLLTSAEVRWEFLRRFVFGIKEAAKTVSSSRESAHDFAKWCHCAWLELLKLERPKEDPGGIVCRK